MVKNDYIFDEAETLRLVNQARQSHKAGKSKQLKSWNDLDDKNNFCFTEEEILLLRVGDHSIYRKK